VNNLPKVVTRRCLEQDLNSRPVDRKPKRLTRCTTAPPVLDGGQDKAHSSLGKWGRIGRSVKKLDSFANLIAHVAANFARFLNFKFGRPPGLQTTRRGPPCQPSCWEGSTLFALPPGEESGLSVLTNPSLFRTT